MTAGETILRRSVRATGRINWRWWGECAAYVLGGFAAAVLLWLGLIGAP